MIISGYSSTPRSGSTLLTALLNQRPDVYMPFHSPFIELLWRNYKFWDDPEYSRGDGEYSKNLILEYKNAKNNYCLGVIDTFFKQFSDKKYIIDKHWMYIVPENRNMYEDLYNKRIPIIYIHRNYDDILESYKRVCYDVNMEKFNKVYYTQCYYLENNPDNIVYIEFDDWCNKTKEMLKYIEVKLSLEPYTYNLKNPSIDAEYIDKVLGNSKLHVLRDATVYKKRY